MAEISGKLGLIEYGGGHVASFDNWSLTADTNMLPVTSFTTGTVQWVRNIPGLSSWNATISGNFDAASTGLDDLRTATLTPATGTVNLYMDKEGGESLTGDTFISSMGHTVAIDGKVEVDFSLQGNGTLTFATTT